MCALLRGWLGAGGVGAMPQTWPSRLPSVCRHAGSCDNGLCPLECVQAVQAGDGSLWSEAGLCFPHVCALLWAMLFSPLVESSIRAQGLEQWLSVAWGVHGGGPSTQARVQGSLQSAASVLLLGGSKCVALFKSRASVTCSPPVSPTGFPSH